MLLPPFLTAMHCYHCNREFDVADAAEHYALCQTMHHPACGCVWCWQQKTKEIEQERTYDFRKENDCAED